MEKQFLNGEKKMVICQNERGAIILDTGASFTPYVVTRSVPHLYEGEVVWNHGAYFTNLLDAVNYLYGIEKPEIPIPRLEELASTALSYLDDTCQLEDYLEDRDIELEENEKEFFNVYPLEDDWDEDDWDLEEGDE